jgi:hypothetical protein
MLASALLLAPGAQASLGWDQTSHDFGGQSVGTASAPKTLTLTATCDGPDIVIMIFCGSPLGGTHNFGSPTVTGEGFALGDPNSCSTGFLSTFIFPSSATCTSTVTFTPMSGGAKTGTLATPTGPDVSLSGTGVATQAASPAPVGAKKKCKKAKRKASATKKKKCKKRK